LAEPEANEKPVGKLARNQDAPGSTNVD